MASRSAAAEHTHQHCSPRAHAEGNARQYTTWVRARHMSHTKICMLSGPPYSCSGACSSMPASKAMSAGCELGCSCSMQCMQSPHIHCLMQGTNAAEQVAASRPCPNTTLCLRLVQAATPCGQHLDINRLTNLPAAIGLHRATPASPL